MPENSEHWFPGTGLCLGAHAPLPHSLKLQQGRAAATPEKPLGLLGLCAAAALPCAGMLFQAQPAQIQPISQAKGCLLREALPALELFSPSQVLLLVGSNYKGF